MKNIDFKSKKTHLEGLKLIILTISSQVDKMKAAMGEVSVKNVISKI